VIAEVFRGTTLRSMIRRERLVVDFAHCRSPALLARSRSRSRGHLTLQHFGTRPRSSDLTGGVTVARATAGTVRESRALVRRRTFAER
jgi:hypothetical protein